MGKKKKQKEIFEERIEKVVRRIEDEEKGEERVSIKANLISSPPGQIGASVKISLQIKDTSFYAKGATIEFSAGTDEWESVTMEKINLDNFSGVLNDVPKETKVLYFIKILDKSGEWVQYPRVHDLKEEDADAEPYFQFTVEVDGGLSYKKEWDDDNLSKCPVCGYMCSIAWDECPECNTTLIDTTQEVFLDDQKKKEEEIEKRKDLEDEIAWSEAQGTADTWKGLPECPNCGYTVQLEWETCPVCSFNISAVKLEKAPVYAEEDEAYTPEEGENEEEKQISPKKLKKKMKEEKEKEKKVPFAPPEDDIDIL